MTSDIDTQNRGVETFVIDWQGITLSVTFETNWLNMDRRLGYEVAHLQVEAINPKRAPLPVTETGYRSTFLSPHLVTECGGPTAFVVAWIDGAAKSLEWREHLRLERERQMASQQLSLF